MRFACAGVSIILGCNGMIWVAARAQQQANSSAAVGDASSTAEPAVTPQQREAVCRVANAVRVLAALSMLMSPSSIMDVCKVRNWMCCFPRCLHMQTQMRGADWLQTCR